MYNTPLFSMYPSHNEFLNMKYLHYLQHQHCSYKHGECHHQRLNAQRKLLEYAKL